MGGDHDNCRILVRREGTRFLDDGAVKVPGPVWLWNGNRKPTRVIPWVAFARGGQTYVAISIHRIPGGPVPGIKANHVGWQAEHRAIVALVEQLRARFPGAVFILGGDWNAKADERPGDPYSLRSLAAALGAEVRVLHIDGLFVIGGRARGVRKLPEKYGSDAHRPVVGQVVAA